MELRWYQREGIAAFYDYFARYTGNPIGAFPTGTGKSYIIAEFLHGAFFQWPASRVLCITHVQELIKQNYDELVGLWPTAPVGIFSAGIGRKEVRPIVFGGIKSMVGKAALFGHIDLVLIDECHLVGPADDTAYQSFISDLQDINPKVKIIGLTATPYRLGQGLLTESTEHEGKTRPPLFTDICYDVTGVEPFNRLIAEGHLCNLITAKTTTELDVSGVKVIGGEFAQSALQDAVDRDEITYACIQETIARAADRRRWLVFATGIRHAEHIATMFDSCGISAVAVHSKTNKEDRENHVEAFKRGEVQALVNPVLYTVGFNFKPIDCIVDLAPTSSANRHVQKNGRGMRPYDYRTEINRELAAMCPWVKTDCLVLDYAGNILRNGPINDPKIPKRRRNKGAAGEEERAAPVRLCPHCATWNHNSRRTCVKCCNEFPPGEVKLTAEASTEAIIIGQAAVMEVFPVEKVEYARHLPHPKSGKPPSLRVIYRSGLRMFTEWVCLEHGGYPSKKARDWWRKAAEDYDTEPPATIESALQTLQTLQRPTHLRVWVNTKEPKIMDYDYSGTAFGNVVPNK